MAPPAPAAGLTSAEATRRLAQFGPNEPVVARRFTALLQLLRLFANPLVIILFVASAISAVLGQVADATIIVTMVMLGVAINFWQGYRSQQGARVGLTPEFLPMITSVTLAEGARRMTREGVIVPRMGVVPFETRPNV